MIWICEVRHTDVSDIQEDRERDDGKARVPDDIAPI